MANLNPNYKRLLRGTDANMVGGQERHKCVLYITDMYSAEVLNKLLPLPSQYDYIGTLAMQGDDWNRMKTDRVEIEHNYQLRRLKLMLGLIDDIHRETYYLDPTNFDRLRYGAVMIMTNNDTNGNNLISFVVNYFHCYFPSLLSRGYVMYYRTPLVRVSKYGQLELFYTEQEYNEWKKVNKNTYSTWTHKYYKQPEPLIQNSSLPDIHTNGIQLQVLFDIYIIPSAKARL